MHKSISKPFISNCLFVSLTAKLKDWKNIKIYKIPSLLIDGKLDHFYYKNLKTNLFYHFIESDEENKQKCHLLFKGEIIEFSREENEEIINIRLRKLSKKLEKSLDFNSELYSLINEKQKYRWKKYTPDCPKDVYTKDNPYSFIEGSTINERGEDIIKFYSIKDKGIYNPHNDDIQYWRVPLRVLNDKNDVE